MCKSLGAAYESIEAAFGFLGRMPWQFVATVCRGHERPRDRSRRTGRIERSAAERHVTVLNPAEPVCEPEEQEQRDRQPDACGKRPDHTLGLALIVHHEI